MATEGDAFTVVFHDAHDAVAFALELQERLLEAHWPTGLQRHPLCATELLDDTAKTGARRRRYVFNGLRVRAAIHTGEPVDIEVQLIP